MLGGVWGGPSGRREAAGGREGRTVTERAEELGGQGDMGPRKQGEQGDEQVSGPLSILKAPRVSLRQEGVLERLVIQPSLG